MKRFFPDRETLKKLMKKGLPFIVAIAWTPVIWLVLTILIGSWMQPLVSPWWVVPLLLGVLTLVVTGALLRFFKRINFQIFDESHS